MRDLLKQLAPEWIKGKRGGRAGFSFLCPECDNHRILVYFALPPDGEDPITMGSAGPIRAVPHTGTDFDSMSLGQAIDHGEDLMVFIQYGLVITG